MKLAFYPQFVDPILNGQKIHTFRKDEADIWQPGMSIEMTTPKEYDPQHIFHRAVCVSTQKIEIKHTKSSQPHLYQLTVIIDGDILGIFGLYSSENGYSSSWSNDVEIRELVENDGFKRLVEFCQYYKADYKGKIIHWTDLRY